MKISIALKTLLGAAALALPLLAFAESNVQTGRRDLRTGRDRPRRFLGRDSEDSVSARRHRLELHDRRA